MYRTPYPVSTYEYSGDQTVPPGVGRIELRGPYEATGRGKTPSRTKLFITRPASDKPADELAAAREILSSLARRAYRRPDTEGDIEPLLAFYRQGRGEGDFDTGIERALRRVLVSPEFLFRTVHDPADAAPGSMHKLNELELASRLSFFLWSSVPDDELLSAAERGELSQPKLLQAQVRRMLADERSAALIDNFAGQWLFLRNLALATPDPKVFPDFDANLAHALEEETRLFLESQLREDRPVVDLLTADYTFLNDRLARHYGIAGIYGTHFRRVKLTNNARFGLLGKGSILTLTSYAHRTSPVLRGKWLLTNILGAPPPPPAPDVPPLIENDKAGMQRSVREQMELHRANAACASCHSLMDPLGFALENFDAIGRWRRFGEGGEPIDATGKLVDGTQVDGPASLRQALVAQQQDFVYTLAERLLTYSLGRGAEYFDGPAIRQIVRQSAADNHRWSSLIQAIVASVPFQYRAAAETSTAQK